MVASARMKWFALALLCVTQFVVVLDIAIVISAYGGKSNVHDSDVQNDHELDGTQKRQSKPLKSGRRHHCCAVLSAGYTYLVERHAFKKQVILEEDIAVTGLIHEDDR